MTCIVAIKKDGVVHMAADSAGSDLYTIRTRVDPKIHKVGPFMFGFTTSFRMGQLLGHAFKAPDRDLRVSTDKFMCTTFIDAVRDCLKAGGWASKDKETEQGGTFIVAYEGRIFTVYDDYQVAEGALPYTSAGCGTDFAMGSLYSTEAGPLSPVERMTTAMMAAEAFSCGVRGPFIFADSGPAT